MKRAFLPLAFVLILLPSTDFDYLPTSTTGVIIKHANYALSYVEEHEQAEWVAYELTEEEVNGVVKRTDNFKIDFHIETGSAQMTDYAGSGFDRGHLAPAADMKFSALAMDESFFMSNMSPQAPQFNRGIWRFLEEQVRHWAEEHGKVYVVTGGVLNHTMGTIGDGVSIPKYYYKVVADLYLPGINGIGLILKNEPSKQPLSVFAVTIDSVEALTGIDFFPQLPDHIEDPLEKTLSLENWSFTVGPKSAPHQEPAANPTSVRCTGTTKTSGKQCKRMTTNQNARCWQHQGH
jgi:endonuclease G